MYLFLWFILEPPTPHLRLPAADFTLELLLLLETLSAEDLGEAVCTLMSLVVNLSDLKSYTFRK
jgi:hypothetical protein